MITLPSRRSAHQTPRADASGIFCAVVAFVTALLLAVATAVPASAYWTSEGTTSAAATTGILNPPTGVTVPETAETDVEVRWTAGAGGIDPVGYYVSRTDGTTSDSACDSSPTHLIESFACTDLGVPAGTYSYTVTAVFRTWTATSDASSNVTVLDAPTILGSAETYSVLAGIIVQNTGSTNISGDVGSSIAAQGFPPGVVGGDIHNGDAAATALADRTAAYNDLSTRTPTTELNGDLNGTTLLPGVFHSTDVLGLTGALTIDANGDPNATFIIQVDAALDTSPDSSVILTNGAQASNVYWVVAGAAVLGANSSFAGTILGQGAITLRAGSKLNGRALAGGAVGLTENTILTGNAIGFAQARPPTMTIDGGPTAAAKDTTPTLTGTSNAKQKSAVTVTIGEQRLSTSIKNDGTWAVTASDVTAGKHVVLAKVRDSAGNASAASQELTVEISPPTVALGAAINYSVLARIGVVNTGSTALSGDLGVSPNTSVTGFPPGTLDGTIHAGDTNAEAAQTDLNAALTDASGRAPHTDFTGDLNGRTFRTGVHHTSAALALTGTVTLDADNDPNAVFIFQTDAALNTATASKVELVNGAQASNVFWIAAGAAGTGANSTFAGTVLAYGAITLGEGTDFAGHALSRDTVTLANSALTGIVGAPVLDGAFDETAATAPETTAATETPTANGREASVSGPSSPAVDPPKSPEGRQPAPLPQLPPESGEPESVDDPADPDGQPTASTDQGDAHSEATP